MEQLPKRSCRLDGIPLPAAKPPVVPRHGEGTYIDGSGVQLPGGVQCAQRPAVRLSGVSLDAKERCRNVWIHRHLKLVQRDQKPLPSGLEICFFACPDMVKSLHLAIRGNGLQGSHFPGCKEPLGKALLEHIPAHPLDIDADLALVEPAASEF